MSRYVTGQQMELRQLRLNAEPQLMPVGYRHAVLADTSVMAVCGTRVEQVTSTPFSTSSAGLGAAEPCPACVAAVDGR